MNICLKLFFVIDDMPICKIQIVKFAISLISLNNKILQKVSLIVKIMIEIKKEKNVK